MRGQLFCKKFKLLSKLKTRLSVTLTICNRWRNLDAWVANADIRLRDGWVWSVDCLRVVGDLLQVSIRSQHILLFAGDGWCNNCSSIVVGDTSIADSNYG
jgi:hypothetical protein